MSAILLNRVPPAASPGIPIIRMLSTGSRLMGIAETAVLVTVTPRTNEAFQIFARVTDLVAGVLLVNALAIGAVDGVTVLQRTKADGDIEIVAIGGTVARTVRWTVLGVS